jgi:hypothetical protein
VEWGSTRNKWREGERREEGKKLSSLLLSFSLWTEKAEGWEKRRKEKAASGSCERNTKSPSPLEKPTVPAEPPEASEAPDEADAEWSLPSLVGRTIRTCHCPTFFLKKSP